jgi:glycosyltransferase involved in cell wall biosynthesis
MSQPIKLLYVVSTLASSGPTNQLYNLISNLDQDVFRASILTLSPEPTNSRYRDFKKLGIQIDSLCLSRFDMMLKGKKLLKKRIKSLNPDIIHTYGIRPDVYINKYIDKYHHCNTIRNYPYEDYIVKFGKIRGTLMAYMHIDLHQKIKYPVSCSFSIANKLKAKHGINTHVIQNGINSEHFSPISIQEKNKLREQLSLPEKVLFVFVGTLIDRKNPTLLIKAFREANISDKASLLILGDGPLYESCNQLKDECIIMRGNVKNVSEYLKASDIFVSPATSEGLPNAVLEAMGTALPVILSDIEPHKEIFKKNTDIGFLFKVDSMSELSKCLKKAVSCDSKMMGEKSRSSLEENFSAKKMSRLYQDFYRNILKSTI